MTRIQSSSPTLQPLARPRSRQNQKMGAAFEEMLLKHLVKTWKPLGAQKTPGLAGPIAGMVEDSLASYLSGSGGLGLGELIARSLEQSSPSQRLTTLVDGGRLSSGFGPRADPINGQPAVHSGIDIAAPLGSPVRAPFAGTVRFVGEKAGLGLAVILDHGEGHSTVYGHLSQADVEIGDRLSSGDSLGKVGNSGRSTGPHLHFEHRVKGLPVNPLKNEPGQKRSYPGRHNQAYMPLARR